MKRKTNILGIVAFIIVIQLIFGIFDGEDTFDFYNIFGVFIAFGVLNSIIRKKQKDRRRSDNEYPSRPTNIYRSSQTPQQECEYCGHLNDKGREYCENCGARQLPD